jgi:putative methionine-R-sulfoxide reductase with GAF domain
LFLIHSPEPDALLLKYCAPIYFSKFVWEKHFGEEIGSMAEKLTGQDISFIGLPTAVFCVECELISKNNTPYCMACGSRALLSLSRLLGGSLRGQQTAHLIEDAELDRLVRELLGTVPNSENRIPASFATLAPSRSHARAMDLAKMQRVGHVLDGEPDIHPGEIELEPAISVIAERAQALTGATGAAIALRQGDEIICRARTGRTAPDLGVRLQTNSGISADCVRTGEIVLCHDAERNPYVDIASCRRLGARSILVAPLRHFRRTLGVFEVLSGIPHAFDNRDVATMQLLSSLMVAAISRLSTLRNQQDSLAG